MAQMRLEEALAHLKSLGYEAYRIHTFEGTPQAPDPHYVYAVGRHNNRQVVIVRQGTDGSFRFYVPATTNPDPEAQVSGMAQWLDVHVGRPDSWQDDEGG